MGGMVKRSAAVSATSVGGNVKRSAAMSFERSADYIRRSVGTHGGAPEYRGLTMPPLTMMPLTMHSRPDGTHPMRCNEGLARTADNDSVLRQLRRRTRSPASVGGR